MESNNSNTKMEDQLAVENQDEKIKDKNIFEPDFQTKQKWLSTRKEPFHNNVVHLPGFYQNSESNADSILFWMAFTFEMVTVCLILFGGLNKSESIMRWASVGTAVLLIILDAIGAYWVHKQKGEICKLNNLMLADPDNQKGYEKEKEKGSSFNFLGKSFIILSGILKMGGIFLFFGIPLTVLFILPLIYGFIIYIHIFHTGYYFANKSFKNRYNNQQDEFAVDKKNGIMSKYSAVIRHHEIISTTRLLPPNSSSRVVGQHELALNSKTNKYTLTTKGVLRDDEIHRFMDGLGNDQKAIISLECLKHQTTNIHVPENH